MLSVSCYSQLLSCFCKLFIGLEILVSMLVKSAYNYFRNRMKTLDEFYTLIILKDVFCYVVTHSVFLSGNQSPQPAQAS